MVVVRGFGGESWCKTGFGGESWCDATSHT